MEEQRGKYSTQLKLSVVQIVFSRTFLVGKVSGMQTSMFHFTLYVHVHTLKDICVYIHLHRYVLK